MLNGASTFGKPNTTFSDDVWAGSLAQTALKNAVAAGANKVLLVDNAFRAMVKWGQPIVGNVTTGNVRNRFSSYEAFDNWTKTRLEKYCYENGFYGIVLNDEPVASYSQNLGEVYKSIKRVSESLGIEVYIHLNLLPADPSDITMIGGMAGGSRDEAWKSYLINVIEETRAERLSIDIYPFMNWGFKTGYYSMLQIFADVCGERNVKTSLCVQLFASDSLSYREQLGMTEIFYQIYNCLGFGIDNVFFYTYISNEKDDCSFVNTDGTKTDLYKYAKSFLPESRLLTDRIGKCSFSGARLFAYTRNFAANSYLANYFSYDPQGENSLIFNNSHKFKNLLGIETDDDLLLVSELKSQSGYVYMLQNVMDRYYVANRKEDGDLTATLQLGGDCKGVIEYYIEITQQGNESVCQLKERFIKVVDGKYTKTLSCGDAVFIKPVYNFSI